MVSELWILDTFFYSFHNSRRTRIRISISRLNRVQHETSRKWETSVAILRGSTVRGPNRNRRNCFATRRRGLDSRFCRILRDKFPVCILPKNCSGELEPFLALPFTIFVSGENRKRYTFNIKQQNKNTSVKEFLDIIRVVVTLPRY